MNNILFLLGGPGSGKDLIIKELNNRFTFKEYNIEQIKRNPYINEDCVISANAYKLNDISTISENLSKNNNLFAIYVDVSDEVSKQRLTTRNINESVRLERLLDSKLNIEGFKTIFENFYYINNSFSISSKNTTDQITNLIESLSTDLDSKRREGLAAAKQNKISYKKDIISAARSSMRMTPDSLDKQTRAYTNIILGRRPDQAIRTEDYENFKSDKETKKIKKIPKDQILSRSIPKKSLAPTYDATEMSGDTNLIHTYSTSSRAFESVDSPNSSDTGLVGVTNSPNVNQTNDKPLFGYELQKDKKPRRKFETDKETQKESIFKKTKRILFKG